MDKKKHHLLAGVFVPVMLLAAAPALAAPGDLLLAQAEEPPRLPPGEAPPGDPSEQMERQPDAEAPPPEPEAPPPEAPAEVAPEPEPPAPEAEAPPEPEAPPAPEAEAPPPPEPEAPAEPEAAAPPEPAAEPEPPAAEAPPEDPEGQQRRSAEPEPEPEAPAAETPAEPEPPAAEAPAAAPETPAEAAPAPESSDPAATEAPRAAEEPATDENRAAEEDRTPETARERRDDVREELRRRQQEGDTADRPDEAPDADAPAAAAAPEAGTEPEADGVADDRRERLRALEDRRERREEALDRDLDEAERDARRAERLRDREERLADREDRLRLFEERQDERLSDIRRERREIRDEEGRVVIVEPGGRRIIRDEGRTIIRYNEIDRLGFGADDVTTEDRDGRTVTTIVRPGGVRVITVTDAEGRVLRRTRRTRDGDDYVLFDNTRSYGRGRDSDDYYVVDVPPPVWDLPEDEYIVEADEASPEAIYEAFAAAPVDRPQQRYSLDQVVNTPALRERVRRVDIDTITFDTGSSRVNEDQIGALETIADAILSVLQKNPNEVFLIEGHTDAVGSDLDNLSLSDRRAEEVAALLTEYYDVPAENLTTKGYGEQYLKVNTGGDERENRRVTMRRITDLLETSQAQ